MTNLHFENNALTELPKLPSHGYDIIRELHLANNKISNLNISNNNITSLESKAVEFLQQRNITFVQSGVYWKCNCENEKLIFT
ncbi:uncharacterized protein Dwil_GK27850 [Drosophila willistoni]|uniref:Uncharacterized protein n=1 Tax=Drosophila willistoni TaxID=7260 RepID=A0A0Q9X6P4_DROWI|nr:uncharacterized protein Dwil_GK27850 [Drosophila willistoni]